MQIFVRLFLGLKMTPNAVFWCRTADVVASASSSSFFFGVVQKLRWPNFAHFWPPTNLWVTVLKEFLYYYSKEKSAYRWHFQYQLSTLSCQHNLWTTPSYIPEAMFNSIKDSCLKYFFQLKISIFSIFQIKRLKSNFGANYKSNSYIEWKCKLYKNKKDCNFSSNCVKETTK